MSKFHVIDGRHRLAGANIVGLGHLRCNVIDSRGNEGLRVIDTKDLAPDPDVQIIDTFKPATARRMAANWDPNKLGVLIVTPAGSNSYSISKQKKAEIKLGVDRDRRKVTPVESFLVEVVAKVPETCAIKRIVENAGYEIGRSGKSSTTIEAVGPLRALYAAGQLERALDFGALWYGEAKTNQGQWLWALGYVVSLDCDRDLSQAAENRLQKIIPGELLREASGVVSVGPRGRGGAHIGHPIAVYIGEKMVRATHKRVGGANKRAAS